MVECNPTRCKSAEASQISSMDTVSFIYFCAPYSLLRFSNCAQLTMFVPFWERRRPMRLASGSCRCLLRASSWVMASIPARPSSIMVILRFPNVSLIQDCHFNVRKLRHGRCMQLYANRDIAKGETLSISYGHQELRREARHAKLRQEWYFECKCDAP